MENNIEDSVFISPYRIRVILDKHKAEKVVENNKTYYILTREDGTKLEIENIEFVYDVHIESVDANQFELIAIALLRFKNTKGVKRIVIE